VAYMNAVEAEDEESRREYFDQHAKTVRDHMRDLGSKAYWNQFQPSPDFVVLFLPGESFFSAALEKDRALIEDGFANRVVLATPTTLITMLRTVAYSWQHYRLAENAQKIAEAGSELFERICKFSEHLSGIRQGLNTASESFNAAVGNWEHRVLPGVRKLKELGAAKAEQDIRNLEPLDKSLRSLPEPTEKK